MNILALIIFLNYENLAYLLNEIMQSNRLLCKAMKLYGVTNNKSFNAIHWRPRSIEIFCIFKF